MIPAEAVEAAAYALFEKELGRPMEVADEGLYAEDIQACREDARAALEAAAPHMLAPRSTDANGDPVAAKVTFEVAQHSLAAAPLVQEFGPVDAASYQPPGHGPISQIPYRSQP